MPVEIFDTYDLIELTYISNVAAFFSENSSEFGTKSFIISPCHNLNDYDFKHNAFLYQFFKYKCFS